jgi:hypothetical protein
VYPLLNQATNELTLVDNLQVAPELRKLYEYLVDKHCIEQLDNFDPRHLNTFSREVLRQIQAGDFSWREHVPAEVAETIERRAFFGYRKTPVERQPAHSFVSSGIFNQPFSETQI